MKKTFTVVLALAMVTSIFSGCGAAKKAETDNKQASNSNKFEFFQMKREAVDTFNTLIGDFQKQNDGITIEQNNVPDGDQILPTRMASQDTPAIFTNWPLVAKFKAEVDDGYILDLSGKDFMKNVDENVRKQYQYNGKDYALPISLNTMGVFYNVKLFKELGIEVPKTYAQFIEACKKIKEAGKQPLIFSDKDAWTSGQLAQLFYGLNVPDINNTIKDIINGKKKVNDVAGFKKAAEKILEIHKYGQEDSLGTSYDDATREFANGNAAMFIQGIWDIPSIKKANPDFEFAMFPMPADKEEDTKTVIGVDLAICLSSKANKKTEKFLEYMSKTENAQKYADMDKSPSAIKGVKNNVKEDKELVDFMNSGKSFIWPELSFISDMNDQNQKINQNLIATKDAEQYIEDLNNAFYNKAK